jgi:phenylalanyl-tRNA synthetase alpha chain
MDGQARELHPLEVKILLRYRPGDAVTHARLATDLDFREGQANQALSWLAAKGFAAETGRVTRVTYELADLGRDWATAGTPEERILRLLAERGGRTLPEIAADIGLEPKEVGSAFGALTKDGAVRMDAEKRATLAGPAGGPAPALPARVAATRALLDRAAGTGSLDAATLSDAQKAIADSLAKKRGSGGVFRLVERDVVTWGLTPAAAEARAGLESRGVSGEEAGALTPEMLRTGAWKTVAFRRYNVDVPPTRVSAGRRNPYCEFLDRLKDKLCSLGFEEFDGPLVETEFWNGDALFMPQFHSARDIHDVYVVKEPTRAKAIEQPWLDQVAATHENGWKTGSRGWGYRFDRDFTRRLILRSQGTVLSAKQLPTARVPGKYFAVARCFRYDQVDATHLADFYQTEGIVLGEEVNLRTLLGLLKMFAEEVAGATEVRYVPGFFPYTEPSIEVHIRHPSLGWFELGGSGIFRPEVTEPLGITVPVLAWGLGIDRMAMVSMGIKDIRDLFTPSIDDVRKRRIS